MAVAEGPVGAAAPAARKPSVGVKFGYSFGQIIESGYLAVSAFIFFYYTAVLGLSGTVVGAALAISLCIDALLDPLIGSYSDNVRSKWGRRLPVMLVGAPLTALSVGLLFAPPTGLAPLGLFLWLVAMKVALRGFASVYNLPYAALGAEMTHDYVERSSVVAWRTVTGTLAVVALTTMAYSVFFAGPGGLQAQDRYPPFGWASALIFLGGGLLCCLGVWRYAVRLPQPVHRAPPLASSLFRGLSEVFRNPSFRALFASALMFWVAAGINGALNNHTYIFVFGQSPGQIQATTYAYLAMIFVGVALTPLLLRRLEKRSVLMLALGILLLCWVTVQGLRAAGLFTATGAAALPWLALNAGVAGVAIGMLSTAYPSTMADAAEEHELLFGERREGLYFAGLGFSAKAAAGLGQLVAGLALDAMRFPKDAGHQAGAAVAEPVLVQLALAWGPLAAVFGLLSLLSLLPYRIDRARHQEILRDLEAARAPPGAAHG